MNKFRVCLVILVITLVLPWSLSWALESSIQPTGVVRYNAAKAQDGYTLVTHNMSNRAFFAGHGRLHCSHMADEIQCRPIRHAAA